MPQSKRAAAIRQIILIVLTAFMLYAIVIWLVASSLKERLASVCRCPLPLSERLAF